MPIRRRRSPLALGATLSLAIAVGGCSPNVPTAAPTPTTAPSAAIASPAASRPSDAQIYAAIRGAVETIRGLQPTADVAPVTIDEVQLVKNLTAEFDSENTPADLRFSDAALITLGLLPPGSSLRELTLDFQGSNVAGYYS